MINCKQKRIEKLNEKGFTLVELLVVVTILAIVVAPFLHSFITAAQTNSKSATLLTATNLAESAMEEFEAYSLDSLNAKHTSTETDGKYSYEFTGDYYSTGTDNYNIKVSLDPKASAATDVYYDLNTASYASIENLNMDTCAIYSMGNDDEDNALANFYQKIIAKGRSLTESEKNTIKGATLRYITVSISSPTTINTADGSFPQVKVKVRVEYRLDASTATSFGLDTGANEHIYNYDRDVYDNKTSLKAISSIYLIYIPRNATSDTITVLNPKNIVANLYVIQQKGVAGIRALKPAINIKESASWASGPSGSFPKDGSGNIINHSFLRLCTNLYTPSVNPTEADDMSKATPNFNVYYYYIPNNYLSLPVASRTEKCFTDTGGNKSNMIVTQASTADGRSLVGEKTKNRIYEMKVEVYKGTELICTMTGSKLD